MIAHFRPRPLAQAAADLGLHPFELVRLRIARGDTLDTLPMGRETLDAVVAYADIETWWTADPAQSADPNNPSAEQLDRLRAVLRMVLSKNHVGEQTTRLDNLWRGLPLEAALHIEAAVPRLVGLGWLGTQPDPRGIRCSLQPGNVDAVQAFVHGGDAPAALVNVETL